MHQQHLIGLAIVIVPAIYWTSATCQVSVPHIISTPHLYSARQILISPLYSQRNWGSRRLIALLKITCPLNTRMTWDLHPILPVTKSAVSLDVTHRSLCGKQRSTKPRPASQRASPEPDQNEECRSLWRWKSAKEEDWGANQGGSQMCGEAVGPERMAANCKNGTSITPKGNNMGQGSEICK